jgi:hypothetical protein
MPDERSLGEVHRHMLVADPDTQVLHLASPGSRASIGAGRIKVDKHRRVGDLGKYAKRWPTGPATRCL